MAYLLDAYEQGQTDCVRAAFDMLERFLIEGDAETKRTGRHWLHRGCPKRILMARPFGAKAFAPSVSRAAFTGRVGRS